MVGDVVLTAKGEMVVVSDVDESGNTIDVYARGDLGSTQNYTTNADSDALYIVGNAQLEGYLWTGSRLIQDYQVKLYPDNSMIP